MRILLNRIDVKSTFWDNTFLLGKIILVLTISVNFIYGIKILPLFKTVEGEIVEVRNNCTYSIINSGRENRVDCMAIRIDSFNHRIIHSNREYAKLFKPKDKVKLWIYMMHFEYIIVQAKRGDEIIIKHNAVLANIVFTLMLGSFILVLLEFIVKKVLPKRK